jgi:hypothetical protein
VGEGGGKYKSRARREEEEEEEKVLSYIILFRNPALKRMQEEKKPSHRGYAPNVNTNTLRSSTPAPGPRPGAPPRSRNARVGRQTHTHARARPCTRTRSLQSQNIHRSTAAAAAAVVIVVDVDAGADAADAVVVLASRGRRNVPSYRCMAIVYSPGRQALSPPSRTLAVRKVYVRRTYASMCAGGQEDRRELVVPVMKLASGRPGEGVCRWTV